MSSTQNYPTCACACVQGGAERRGLDKMMAVKRKDIMSGIFLSEEDVVKIVVIV